MDFREQALIWIDSRISTETRLAYKRDLELWLRHCNNPENPDLKVVVEFRDMLVKKYAPLSARRILSSLSAVYGAIAPRNPFSEKSLPRPPASRFHKTDAVSDEDARRVIEAAGTRGKTPLRDVALLWLLWTTGMRRVSAVSIRRSEIKKVDGVWKVGHIVKGGSQEESELTTDTYRAIQDWLDVAPRSGWLFCRDNGEALSTSAVTKIVSGAANSIGLHVSPHMFRSAAATTLLNANTPIEQVQAFLHHRDIRSTQRYDRGKRAAGIAAKLAEFRASKG